MRLKIQNQIEMTQTIKYSDGKNDVRIGDHVKTRIFLFLTRTGRVTHIPGISALHQQMEHDGIRMVGVKFDEGGFGGFWVDPENDCLIKTVTFLERDNSGVDPLPPAEAWDD